MNSRAMPRAGDRRASALYRLSSRWFGLVLIALGLTAANVSAQVRPQPAYERVQDLPACTTGIEGWIFFLSTDTDKKGYICSGTLWEPISETHHSQKVELLADYLGCVQGTANCQVLPWYANNTGTGASCQSPNAGLISTSDFSLLQCDTGTTNTGRAAAVGATDMWPFGGGESTFETRIYFDDLSDGTEGFAFFTGFSDSVTSAFGVDTAGFRYSDDENAGKWLAFTRSNSTESTCDTGVTVAADAWYKLRVVVNADATLATFYVADAARCTITTNIPTGTVRASGIVPVQLVKTSGTTQRNVYVDYTYVRAILTGSR